MAFGIYVHWPFCAAKCPYCDFNSHVRAAIDEDGWVDRILAELDWVAANQTTAFTYQGQLNDHGALTSNVYPMAFTLYDSPTGGSIVAGPINQNIQVVNGLFTTDLDFGLIFGPTQYYLQIDVNGTPLSSRQPHPPPMRRPAQRRRRIPPNRRPALPTGKDFENSENALRCM